MRLVPPKQTSRRTGLARAISKLGYCSRSQASQLIRAGRVRLNETVRRDPEIPVNLQHDRIAVNNERLEARERVYLMLNKSRGVVTTASDEKGRQTVYDALRGATRSAQKHDSARRGLPPRDVNDVNDVMETDVTEHDSSTADLPWVSPVGRLDKASEGLLLLTNDSEWAACVTAPITHLEKTYHVQIGMVADEAWTQSLMRGVRLDDGEVLRAKQARLIRSGQKNCWIEIILDEGKNRQIRRILAARGVGVLRLVRVAIGPLHLGKLAKSEYRRLTKEEKRSLDRAMQRRSD